MGPAFIRQRLAGAATLALLIAIFAIIAFYGLRPNNRIRYDEQAHHLPTILRFSEQLPAVDLKGYAVATTPGYHLIMAAAHRWLGVGETGLRFINIAISMALAGMFGWAIAGKQSFSDTVLLGLPLVSCVYVISSAAWLIPENMAWGLIVFIFVIALRPLSVGSFVGVSIALALLVLVRQSQAWCGAIVFAIAVNEQSRLVPRQLVASVISIVPAAVILAIFTLLWGGLVPPMFQPGGKEYELSTQYGGLGPAAAGFLLALVGLFGIFLVPWYWQSTNAIHRRWLWISLAIGAAIGFVASSLPETSYHFPDRRSGIWRAVAMGPVIAERSPPLILLASAGGAVAAMVIQSLRPRDRILFAIALVAFAMAQTTNPMIWQRYYEPFVLIWLLLAASRIERGENESAWSVGLRWSGAAILCLAQVAITLLTLRAES